MKERPILMSAPMVRALLDGRKTQTRRTGGLEDVNKEPGIWTPYGGFTSDGFGELGYMAKKSAKGKPGATFKTRALKERTLHVCPQVCPQGKPGDWLWVKETFHWSLKRDAIYRTCIDAALEGLIDHYRVKHGEKWVPSIFMPRWLSRIQLEITGVRVQRLQEISWEDCVAEGIVGTDAWIAVVTQRFLSNASVPDLASMSVYEQEAAIDAGSAEYLRAAYRSLWEQLNGAGSWDANPWVWAISFNVLGGAA